MLGGRNMSHALFPDFSKGQGIRRFLRRVSQFVSQIDLHFLEIEMLSIQFTIIDIFDFW